MHVLSPAMYIVRCTFYNKGYLSVYWIVKKYCCPLFRYFPHSLLCTKYKSLPCFLVKFALTIYKIILIIQTYANMQKETNKKNHKSNETFDTIWDLSKNNYISTSIMVLLLYNSFKWQYVYGWS